MTIDQRKAEKQPASPVAPPAVKVPLTGQYLIEASAGTGKTWTLTGIVLRLLIEARRAPEQIIATTFTRAAAAEMRERIHARLTDFYQLLQWVNRLHNNLMDRDESDKTNLDTLYPKILQIIPAADLADSTTQNKNRISDPLPKSQSVGQSLDSDLVNSDLVNLDKLNTVAIKQSKTDKDNPHLQRDLQHETQRKKRQAQQDRRAWLDEQAKRERMAGNHGIDDILQDPINIHLIEYLLDHVQTYPLAEAIRRTALVLTTLDKLYVGTLDSLAQKWLAEYSSETGYQLGMAIIEEDSIDQVIDGIIHNELRQFQSRLYHEQPKIYEIMAEQGMLTSASDHKSAVKRALNFVSAPIDAMPESPSFDMEAYEAVLADFAAADFSQIEPYLDEDYRAQQGFDKRGKLNTRFYTINEIKRQIQAQGIHFQAYLSNDAKQFMNEVRLSEHPDDKGKYKGFKKANVAQHQALFALTPIKQLLAIADASDKLDSLISTMLTGINRHIAISVRQKLPIILEEQNQTTFTLQMVRLNHALSGKQGEKLARYIRHHYPVALIDESQDINGEQATMIERIYLPSKRVSGQSANQSANHPASLRPFADDKGFLLLVGDPKQAIYGFRGGDVANYNFMKRQFDSQHIMTLDINRRSNAHLIDSLNHWFGREDGDSDPSPLSELGEDIHYQHIKASNDTSKLSWHHLPSTAEDLSELCKDNDSGDNDCKPNHEPDDNTLISLFPNQPVSIIHLTSNRDKNNNKKTTNQKNNDKTDHAPSNVNKFDDLDEHQITALHIKGLLTSNHQLDGKPIKPSDIGVLGRAKRQLQQVESMLIKLGVPTLATSEVSIFSTVMAADIGALMTAMLQPYSQMVNRVLTSKLYGLTLSQVKAMLSDASDSDSADMTTQKPQDKKLDNSASAEFDKSHNPQRYQDFIAHLKRGILLWESRGILSALHHLLGSNPILPQGVWQSLASHPQGERHIMDLRHIMDILAEYGMDMGEHELLSWYRQHLQAQPTSDWARQYPLPTESGVQLMTIHKSKGLEFPIVYVIGMDKASKKADKESNYPLYLYNSLQCNAHQNNSHQNNTQQNNTQQNNTQQNHQASLSKGNTWAIGAQRRLSPVAGTSAQADYFANIETAENFAELKRLGYVAFTRASEQLYIVASSLTKKTDIDLRPLFLWLDTEDKTLSLPQRLQGQIGWIEAEEIADVAEQLMSDANQTCAKQEDGGGVINIDYPEFREVIPTVYFQGWAKTSFTALARQLDESAQAVAVVDERIDDMTELNRYARNTPPYKVNNDETLITSLIDANSLSSYLDALKPESDIRFDFVRGANAGTFLHEVYEKIDFADSSQWSQVIDRAISSYQLPLIYASSGYQRRVLAYPESRAVDDSQHQALIGWIKEVLTTPLLASKQPLQALAPSKRFAELGFNMGLTDSFRPEAINELFLEYLPDSPDKHIVLQTQDHSHLYRYLRGEIDLVYEYEGKYYVVDYKSNHLGNSLSNYNQTTLADAMSRAGYWLQAAIYQVALHRYLSMRIRDYEGNEANYLGAVEYVFLRGVYNPDHCAVSTVNASSICANAIDTIHGSEDAPLDKSKMMDTSYGLVTWDIPIDFIKALDKLFGKAQ